MKQILLGASLLFVVYGAAAQLLQKMRHVVADKKLKFLKEEIIKPRQHIDAVKIEANGHLNKDYKKEILIGNHEHFEQFPEKKQEQMLREIFSKVDTDRNGKLKLLEIEQWIISKVDEHFGEARLENEEVFKQIDANNNGQITWAEYLVQILKAKGINATKQEAVKLVKDAKNTRLSEHDKDQILSHKFRWTEADENSDENLNFQEFKNFHHPEGSKRAMHGIVKDILENLDTNDHNGKLSEEEFVRLPDGDLEGQFDTDAWKNSDNTWMEERRNEFRNIIDTNNDGEVNREELLNYVDPHNPNHARNEAKNLIEIADQNKDMQLSLDEVLRNKAVFLGSKMVNPGNNFHNEL